VDHRFSILREVVVGKAQRGGDLSSHLGTRPFVSPSPNRLPEVSRLDASLGRKAPNAPAMLGEERRYLIRERRVCPIGTRRKVLQGRGYPALAESEGFSRLAACLGL
jgi:hypothetical protein